MLGHVPLPPIAALSTYRTSDRIRKLLYASAVYLHCDVESPDTDTDQMAVYAVVRLVGAAEAVVGVSLVAELLRQKRCAASGLRVAVKARGKVGQGRPI